MRSRDSARYARITPDPYQRQGVTRVGMGPHTLRFLLDRSSESAGRGESSQDCLVVQDTPDGLCFAVTDGVGSSFLGELAARLLATYLVNLLTELRAVPDERRLADELTRGLHGLSDDVREEVRRYPIPSHVTGVLRSVLEEQREYGSEAMFVCGRLDVTRGRSARVGLAWLGDSYLRVLTDTGEQSLTGTTADRWSTDRGPRGRVRAWADEARHVRRIIACTDGLLPEIASVVTSPDDELDVRLAVLAQRGDSDDIALVDIALRADAMPPSRTSGTADRVERQASGRPDAPLSAIEAGPAEVNRVEPRVDSPAPPRSAPEELPAAESSPMTRPSRAPGSATYGAPGTPPGPVPAAGPRWRPRTDGGRLSWIAIPDAEKYTVELDSDPDFAAPIAYETSRTEFAAPTMGSRSWARVRGHVHGRAGRWGEPLQLDEAPPSVERGPRRPTFRRVQVDEGRGLVHLEWDGVPGRNSYVLRLEPFHGSQPPRQLAVLGHHATLPLKPASYRISVRADRGRNADDSSGDDWSDHIDVRIR